MSEQFRFKMVLAPAAERLGIELSDRQLGQLERLAMELRSWNERVNLTSITDPEQIATRHLLDSLTVVPVLRRIEVADSLVDVGAGGGFPGLPIAISLPELQVTLVDATAKKVAFLDHAIESLGLANARAAHSTAEELGRAPEHRGAYDASVARAVGPIAALVELLVPLAHVEGFAIVMKKRSAVAAEVADAEPALAALAATVREIVDPGLDDLLPDRAIVVMQKTSATPERFPRRPGVPRRRPLVVTARS